MIVKTEKDLLIPYETDTSNLKGNAQKLIIPESSEELIKAVQDCYSSSCEFIIAGSGTGITGGRVPNQGTVISTEKLNNIFDLNEEKRTVKLQSGVTLLELDDFVKQHKLFYPPNPTEWNSSIGGNLATNASGSRTFKYGATRDWVNYLKVALANGDILEIRRGEVVEKDGFLKFSTEKKDYEIPVIDIHMPKGKHAAGFYLKKGMDLIDLFIGSEGILCAFVEAELQLCKRNENILGGLIFFDENEKLLQFVNKVREISKRNHFDGAKNKIEISARLIEYFDEKSLKLLRTKFNEIPEKAVGAIWFEQEIDNVHEEEILEKWYSLITESTTFADETWMALNENDHKKLADFRHALPLMVYEEISSNNQRKVGTDTAVPVKHFDKYYRYINDIMNSINLTNVTFGHIGDCHIHSNIFAESEEQYSDAMKVYDMFISKALEYNGTVSAEHGIGKLKKKYLYEMYGNSVLDVMKNIKYYIDDKYLLAKGTMFD